MTAVLMPIIFAADETKGPPELPGFKAASVWIRSSMTRPLPRRDRPTADTMPAVTVDSNPRGLPMAMAICPGLTFFESPSWETGSFSFVTVSQSPPRFGAPARAGDGILVVF